MAKLSELVEKIDNEAKSGNRRKAIAMLDKLLEKVPGNSLLESRKEQYTREHSYEKRIIALEQKHGIS